MTDIIMKLPFGNEVKFLWGVGNVEDVTDISQWESFRCEKFPVFSYKNGEDYLFSDIQGEYYMCSNKAIFEILCADSFVFFRNENKILLPFLILDSDEIENIQNSESEYNQLDDYTFELSDKRVLAISEDLFDGALHINLDSLKAFNRLLNY